MKSTKQNHNSNPSSHKSTSTSTSNKKKKKNVIIPQHMTENESLELVASPIGPIRTHAVSTLNSKIILDRLSKEIVQNFGYTMSPLVSSMVGGKESSSSKKRKRPGVVAPIDDIEVEEKKQRLALFAKSRLVIGTNSCTRAFEQLYSSLQKKSEKVQVDDEEGPVGSKQIESFDNATFKESSSSSSNATDGKTSIVSKQISLCILARDVRPPTILAHIPYLCQQLGVPILLLPGKASHDLGSILGGRKVSVLLFRERPDETMAGTGANTDKRHHDKIDSYIEFAKSKLPKMP